MQFSEGEARNLSDSDIERGPRDVDDLKNGMFQAYACLKSFT